MSVVFPETGRVNHQFEQHQPAPEASTAEPSGNFVHGVRLRIFLVSFTLLFFELLCIRWIPAYVRYLSYFTNFILLASFLGMGLGILAARRRGFRFPPFPFMVLLLAAVVALNRFELNISSTDVLYFGSGTTGFASCGELYPSAADLHPGRSRIRSARAHAWFPLHANRAAHRLHLRHPRQPRGHGRILSHRLLRPRADLLVRHSCVSRPASEHAKDAGAFRSAHARGGGDRVVSPTAHPLVALLQDHAHARASRAVTNSTSTASGIRA